MIFDTLRQGSPAENFLRKIDQIGEMELSGEGQRRLKLRRIRSLPPADTAGNFIVPSDFEINSKKNKSEAQIPKLTEKESSEGLVCESYGSKSVIGRRREMEDAVAVKLGFLKNGDKNYDFFGVYDGHGGCLVAHACGEMLHEVVADIARSEAVIDWEKVMVSGFERMDVEVNNKGAVVANVGSTAVVAVVGNDEVVVANCGDSRAVICRGGVAVQLSDDHKPDRPDELERIELAGGKVINWNGQRVLGVLATSRSIGDQYLKPYVITEPEVRVVKRTSVDEFLILASDGLWDVIPNDIACKVASKCLSGQLRRNSRAQNFEGTPNARNRASEAAAFLAELAIARGSSDNVSVTVVELSRSGSR